MALNPPRPGGVLFSNSLMDAMVLEFWPFTMVSAREMMGYMLNVKLLGVFFGAVFLVSYIWGRRLKRIGS